MEGCKDFVKKSKIMHFCELFHEQTTKKGVKKTLTPILIDYWYKDGLITAKQ